MLELKRDKDIDLKGILVMNQMDYTTLNLNHYMLLAYIA